MNAWIEQVYETIQYYQLLHSGDTVLVALSGGADSVALLSAMCNLKDRLDLKTIHAAHLHHGLRGASADRDEAFVRSLCRSMDIPLTISYADVAKEARIHKESVEEAGRRLRYAFFDEVADSLQAPTKIAVAHNADDQAETVLFRIARGTGPKGLQGIPIQRDRIIRPLLTCSSSSIREYCRENRLSFMIDETNEDVLYARNRIRHRILPELKQVNSAVVPHICRLANILAQEDSFLDELGKTLVKESTLPNGYNAILLKTAHPVITRRALIHIIHLECDTSADAAQIESLITILQNDGCFGGLPHRTVACCSHGLLSFRHKAESLESVDSVIVLNGNRIVFQGATIQPTVITYHEFLEKSKIHKNFLHYCISYDMIMNDMYIRSRATGDRLRLPKSRGSKSLKKLFNEWKIPQSVRSNVPIVCDGSRAIAVLGYGVEEAYAIHAHTRQIVYFQITK